MSISADNKIYLDNISNQENSLVNTIRVLSDFTIKDIKKIESANGGGVRETYYSSSNGRIINKKIE